jgi:SAM-dependent methyltransferase
MNMEESPSMNLKSSPIEEYARRMRADWDARARQNARHYIADAQVEWSDDDFWNSGELTVASDILTDMTNICQGREPCSMKVLELGCGAGRVTKALANIFGEVHGVDVSGEMVKKARAALSSYPRVHIHHGDGMTLDVLGEADFHFAYSCCVFHHISSYDVIRSYVREFGKRLVPGALFKFEVQGCTDIKSEPGDTWLGVPFSERQARDMAEDCGFELRYHAGAGQERFWLWYFKR